MSTENGRPLGISIGILYLLWVCGRWRNGKRKYDGKTEEQRKLERMVGREGGREKFKRGNRWENCMGRLGMIA